MELTACKDTSAGNTDVEWTIRVDRGGLCVKNTTYLLFVAIEEEVKQCLKRLLTGSGHKSAIVKAVVESEEVQFYWLIAQADFDVGDDETYQLLLHEIIELYVTIRGHSYSSNLMENTSKLQLKEPSMQRLSVMNCTMKMINFCLYFNCNIASCVHLKL